MICILPGRHYIEEVELFLTTFVVNKHDYWSEEKRASSRTSNMGHQCKQSRDFAFCTYF